MLANRLIPLPQSLISLDQVGFVPGREAWDNTVKTLYIHHWLKSHVKLGFLSLDAEKAFGRVAWDYLHASLEALGLPHQNVGCCSGSIFKSYGKSWGEWFTLHGFYDYKWHTTGLPSFSPYLHFNYGTIVAVIAV